MPSLDTKRLTLNAKRGFTLIELLVVIGILAMVVGATTLFLSSVLRGTNQATVTAEVKQNGAATLDAVERQIRGAVDVVGVGSLDPVYPAIKVIRADGSALYIACLAQTSSQNDRIGTYVTTADADVSLPSLETSATSVSNDNRKNGVNIDTRDCGFTVTSGDATGGIPAVVGISFVATQGLDAAQRADTQTSAKFETTISLRSYK